ncbi:hypothetical protein F5Y04DRAFT_168405 [Hypomontagnella monticulosa]|nr:hypothetical protein F5Y04DRAFT_168405 [Hypomontagnella monticulosa]
MAHKKSDEQDSSVDDHAQLLYSSLEQYNNEQKRRRRPSILLAALISLFLSATGGMILAIVLMLQPIDAPNACIARDLVLFASVIALLYICLHIRGARKDYRRRGPGPPQTYGNYLHAGALLVARLGIAVWIAALVATAVMIGKAVPAEGLAKTAPYLNLVVCIGAIPSFIMISASIESNPTPFATTGFSKASFLSHPASESTDDLTADLSVSRRASLQRKESNSSSIVTVPTAEIFKLGKSKSVEHSTKHPDSLTIRTNDLPNDRMELMANSPIGPTYNAALRSIPLSSAPPMPPLPQSLSKSPPQPQPVYDPGGWRSEWSNIAQRIDTSTAPDASISSSSVDQSASYSSDYSYPQSSSSRSSTPPKTPSKGHRVTPSTSIASSAQRSRLSTVRYASEPEVAIRQAIRVIKNPNYSPVTVINIDKDGEVIRPPEPAALRSTQQQVHATVAPTLKRKPSNFSRPMPPSRDSEIDSAIGMRMPGTFDHEFLRG